MLKKESIRMQPKFSRIAKVIGEDNLNVLNSKSVLVLGCGGVGSYVVEGLVRSGIGKIILVDFDVIDETNINRQIMTYEDNIGALKVDTLEDRIKKINSNCSIVKISEFISPDNISLLFNENIDFFVDACDTVSTKKCVIKECSEREIPFISCMGTGNKFDPSKLEIVNINKTYNDPLARVIRKYVKDEKIKGKVIVLSSTELPVKVGDRVPGSLMFVPASAGIMIASYIVRLFIKKL